MTADAKVICPICYTEHSPSIIDTHKQAVHPLTRWNLSADPNGALVTDAPTIRRRSKLNQTVKGDITPECTLESTGLTLDEHMAELNLLWAATRAQAQGEEVGI